VFRFFIDKLNISFIISFTGGDEMKHGEITKLAKKVGVSPAHMAFIVKGQRRPSPDLARRLEKETGVNRNVWLYPDESSNPLLCQDDTQHPEAKAC
jgi:hypothetical protein